MAAGTGRLRQTETPKSRSKAEKREKRELKREDARVDSVILMRLVGKPFVNNSVYRDVHQSTKIKGMPRRIIRETAIFEQEHANRPTSKIISMNTGTAV